MGGILENSLLRAILTGYTRLLFWPINDWLELPTTVFAIGYGCSLYHLFLDTVSCKTLPSVNGQNCLIHCLRLASVVQCGCRLCFPVLIWFTDCDWQQLWAISYLWLSTFTNYTVLHVTFNSYLLFYISYSIWDCQQLPPLLSVIDYTNQLLYLWTASVTNYSLCDKL
jgi:hypothetical protein